MTPDISVAVVNWNRREYLRVCLQSLAAQRGADFEVIVVDNGSSDGSAGMARSEFGATVHRKNQTNLGFCAANNQAFAAARGQFVALLNNDAEAAPDFLANLRRVFDEGPDIGMAAAKVLVWEDPRRIDKVGNLIYPDGQNRGRGTGEIDNGQFDRMEDCLWPDGCAAMYRKAMLDSIGGFDELLHVRRRCRVGAARPDRRLALPVRAGAVVRHHRGASIARDPLSGSF